MTTLKAWIFFAQIRNRFTETGINSNLEEDFDGAFAFGKKARLFGKNCQNDKQSLTTKYPLIWTKRKILLCLRKTEKALLEKNVTYAKIIE